MIARLLLLPCAAAFLVAPGASAKGLKERVTLRGHPEGINCLAFSPDGRMLASGSRGYDRQKREAWGEVRLWDVVAGKETAILKAPRSDITCVAFSPDGKTLAAGSFDRMVRLWGPTAGKELVAFRGMTSHIVRLAFSPDGKRLAAAGDMEVRLWEVDTAREVGSFRRLVRAYSSAFSPDLTLLASPNHQDVDLWDVSTGKERRALLDHRGAVHLVAFSGDGKTLVAASSRYEEPNRYFGEIRVWDVTTGKERATYPGSSGFFRDMALSSDARVLVLIGQPDPHGPAELQLLDLRTGRLGASLPAGPRGTNKGPWHLAISPDGKVVAVGYGDGAVRLWDVLPSDDKPPSQR